MKEILRLPQYVVDFEVRYLPFNDPPVQKLIKNAIDRKMIVPYPPEMHEEVLRKGYCITVKDDEEVVYT